MIASARYGQWNSAVRLRVSTAMGTKRLEGDDPSLRRAKLYRSRAAEARGMADSATYNESRAALLSIAAQWERLAAELELKDGARKD